MGLITNLVRGVLVYFFATLAAIALMALYHLKEKTRYDDIFDEEE